jgi:hypothetical protein
MFYKKDEYKNEIKKLFDRKGFLIKLIDQKINKTIGNIIRYEINNNNEKTNILVNISLFNSYKNYFKYSEKDLKFFGIKHAFKNENDLDKLLYIDIDDPEFDSSITKFILDKDEKIDKLVIEFVIAKLKNIKFYYKNKNIGMFLV